MNVHFSSATDLHATPQDFFDKLDAEFDFDLDVCASPENAKCHRYYTKADDGLAQDWGAGTVWMNPVIWPRNWRMDAQGKRSRKKRGHRCLLGASAHRYQVVA